MVWHGKIRWIITVAFIILGSGAAAGTILIGYTGGEVAVDVSFPLELEEPWTECPSEDQDVFVSLDYEHKAFRVIVEVQPGDCYLIHLPIINKATVDVRALLSLYYSPGVSAFVTGKGVIDDVVAMSYYDWTFTVDAGSQGVLGVPYDGVQIQVCVSSYYTGPTVEITGSIEMGEGISGPFLIPLPKDIPIEENTIYLHNNPTPPIQDTDIQANLSMNTYYPTTGALYNYDQDRDAYPGRTIRSGGIGPTETNLEKYQNWQMTASEDLNIVGSAAVVLWSATKNFDQMEPGIVTAYLRDLSITTSTDIASATLSFDPWQQGSTSWVERKIIISGIDYVVPAGHTLELTLIVEEGSSDILVAYDTTVYLSRFVLNIDTGPWADFSAELDLDADPLTVDFSDLSTSADTINSWSWDFGDTGASTEQHPSHTYAAEGDYTVTLMVQDTGGASNTVIKTYTITETEITLINTGPTAAFAAIPISGEEPLTVDFTDLSTSTDGIVSWSWDFGDTETSTAQNPTHTYDAAGTYDMFLTVVEADSDSDTEAKTNYIMVSVSDAPTADFSATPTSGYEPLTVNFTDLSISSDGIVSWAWDFGDTGTSSEQNPSHEYQLAGTYDVSLTITEIDMDSDSEIKTAFITVVPAGVPIADFSATPTSGYEPLTVSFTDLSISSDGITSWAWDFGDTGTSSEQNPSYEYQLTGAYTVSLTVTEADSDNDTETKAAFITVAVGATYAIVYQGDADDGFLKTPAIVPSGQITDTVIDALEFDVARGVAPDIINVSGNVYAIVYAGDVDVGYLKTVEIAGDGQITDTVIDTLEFDVARGVTPNIINVLDSVYAIAYVGDGDDGFLKTVEIGTDGQITDTVIDTLEFDTVKGKTPDILRISGDVYAIAYVGDGDDGFLKTVEIATDGQITDTIIDTLEFDTVKGVTPNIINVLGSVYAIVYAGDGDDGYLKTVEIGSNGQITDTVIDTLEFDTLKGKTPDILRISGDVYAIAYAGDADDGFLKTVEIATDGQITDTVIDTLEFDAVQGKVPNIIHVSGNVYAIAYQGDGDDGFLKTVEIGTNAQITDTIIDTLEFDVVQGKGPNMIIHISGSPEPPAPNQPPVAVDDSASTDENTSVIINVLANDTDPDGHALSVTNLTQPSNGMATLNGDNTVTYTPNEGYTGSDSFTYTANDGLADSNVATVNITVTVVP